LGRLAVPVPCYSLILPDSWHPQAVAAIDAILAAVAAIDK
jgi:hypothetical protein